MKNISPMAGVAETMAALDLSDEEWDTMPRAVGHKLRRSVFLRGQLLTACRAVREGWEKNLSGPMRLVNEAIAAADPWRLEAAEEREIAP